MALDVLSAPAALTIGNSSVASGVLTPGQWQLTASGGACWITVGTSPTAVAGNAANIFIPQNYPIYINIPPGAYAGGSGATFKVAVIQDGASTGKLSLVQNV